MHQKEKTFFYVYILASLSGTLYVGLTDDLPLRLLQHLNGTYDGFTRRYRINRLVYVEAYRDSQGAAAREKQIKKFRREKEDCVILKIKSQVERFEPRLIRSP